MVTIGIALNSFDTFEKRAKLDSVGLLASRVESTLYMTDALEKAEIQIEFDDEYNITEEEGTTFLVYQTDLIYKSGSEKSGVELDPPTGFNAGQGRSKYFCISKERGVSPTIFPEKC